MTREKYNPQDNKFVSHDEIDEYAVSQVVYDTVGAEFPIEWRNGDPIVDSSKLPDGVSMSDVKNAIKEHHPRA